jgi:hypothetical protein
MPPLCPNIEEIRRSVALFMEMGAIIELRVPKTEREGTISGYFSGLEELVQAAIEPLAITYAVARATGIEVDR